MTSATIAPSSTAAPLLPLRKKRSLRGPIIAAAAALLGVAAWQLAPRLTSGDEAPTYTTAPAAKTDLTRTVTASGTLSPLVQVEVSSQVSGRIQSLSVDYNSTVTAGQVIAQLEPQLFESALSSAKAKLSSAYADHKRTKAVAANAVSQYARVKSLAAAGAMSQADADAALATKRSAEASVSASLSAITVAKAAVEQAELNLAYTTIRSPIDGVIVSRSIDVGQTVAASLSAPVLFLIAEDLRKMEVHTSVAESDIGQLVPGMAVEFSVDAFPTDTFSGEIKQVRYEATTVSNVVTYDAVIAVNNPDLKLRPGMTANASFILEAASDVLAVSNKAFGYRPPETLATIARSARRGAGRANASGRRPDRARRSTSQRRLHVLRDGAVTTVRVETGMTDGTSTAITGGDLEPGDLVVLSDGANAEASPAAQNRQRGGGRRRGPPSVF